MPLVIDGVLGSNVFATRMLSKAQPGSFNAGRMKTPFKYAKSGNGTSFSGLDTFTTAAADTRINLEFEQRFYGQPVTLPLTELIMNDSEGQVLDLERTEMISATQDMADDIGSLFYGDGTGNGNKDFLGLEGIVDDGTNVATYGGQSRTTYTGLNATVTASGGTLTLALLDTLHDAVAAGSVAPNEIYTTPTVFSFYSQLLQAQERIVKTGVNPTNFKGFTGFTALDYRGAPVFKDEKCTDGVLYMINSNFMEFYASNMTKAGKSINMSNKIIKGNDYQGAPKNMGFAWTGFNKAQNALGMTGYILLGGELFSTKPNAHGKLTGITSV